MTDTTSTTGRTTALPQGHVEVCHLGSCAFKVAVRGHAPVTDQLVEAGGDDRGPTPVEILVVPLASCVAYSAGRFLERHHVDCQRLRVAVTSR
ncbi:OsmC family protein [Streptomyces filipinensis]|uniref:OsmC family protein n=1 Tax=Streptomyces filipinensis TaxID=66887 RepID=UPI0036E495B9